MNKVELFAYWRSRDCVIITYLNVVINIFNKKLVLDIFIEMFHNQVAP